jgi:uncharacterized protein YegL
MSQASGPPSGPSGGANGANGAHASVASLFAGAAQAGTISAATSTLLTGHLGSVVIAGAAGMDTEDIMASEVTLVTVLIDKSSSIASRTLEQSIRDGQNLLVEAFATSRERDSVLMALWTFNNEVTVHHAYVPVTDALKLDASNYAAVGSTRLYDTWCDALAANVAYAQRLQSSGTPCRSIVVIITDGEDCGSRQTASACKKISRDLLASEQFVLAFVGVGSDVDFHKVAKSMGVPDDCIAVQANATPATMRQLFRMVSQSAVRASTANRVGPGQARGFFAP